MHMAEYMDMPPKPLTYEFSTALIATAAAGRLALC
jgi:hypothetical protein